MNLGSIWTIIKELVPLLIALYNAIKGSDNKPETIREIKKQCTGIACAPETKKD